MRRRLGPHQHPIARFLPCADDPKFDEVVSLRLVGAKHVLSSEYLSPFN